MVGLHHIWEYFSYWGACLLSVVQDIIEHTHCWCLGDNGRGIVTAITYYYAFQKIMWVHSCQYFELANPLIAYMSVIILNPVDISDALLHFSLPIYTCTLYDFPSTWMNGAHKEPKCLAHSLCSFCLSKLPGKQPEHYIQCPFFSGINYPVQEQDKCKWSDYAVMTNLWNEEHVYCFNCPFTTYRIDTECLANYPPIRLTRKQRGLIKKHQYSEAAKRPGQGVKNSKPSRKCCSHLAL